MEFYLFNLFYRFQPVFHIEREEIETIKEANNNNDDSFTETGKHVEDDIDLVENYKKRHENGLNIYLNKYKYKLVDTNKVSCFFFFVLSLELKIRSLFRPLHISIALFD